jgi:hypothetical protein
MCVIHGARVRAAVLMRAKAHDVGYRDRREGIWEVHMGHASRLARTRIVVQRSSRAQGQLYPL